jgi:hypothetical protein
MTIVRCAECGAVQRSGGVPGACARCRSELGASAPQQVDAAALVATIVSSPAPVLVDFEPDGQQAAPIADVAPELTGELVCLRVDTAREPAAAAAYRVPSGATLVLFDGGVEVARVRAPRRADDIARWIATAAQR